MKPQHKFNYCMNPQFEKQRRNGRIWGGILVLAVGVTLLVKAMGYYMPAWLFTWPMLLVLLGIYTLGKHGFTRLTGLLPLTVGSIFLLEKIDPGLHIGQMAWPIVIIAIGLAILFKPRKKWSHDWKNVNMGSDISGEDFLQIESIFGGVEKNILSKNFKGGNINVVFGGVELNLMQSDIQGTVIVDIQAAFGGVEITVPANWKVQNEITAVLGGIEDKRPFSDEAMNGDKTLMLKGSVVFGGVSVKSY